MPTSSACVMMGGFLVGIGAVMVRGGGLGNTGDQGGGGLPPWKTQTGGIEDNPPLTVLRRKKLGRKMVYLSTEHRLSFPHTHSRLTHVHYKKKHRLMTPDNLPHTYDKFPGLTTSRPGGGSPIICTFRKTNKTNPDAKGSGGAHLDAEGNGAAE